MNTAYLLLGSNQGDRTQWLSEAISHIEATCGEVTMRSAVYETEAWGIEDQPSFLNMALRIETALPPMELLKAVDNIEWQLGRQRDVKWGPRTLDIDILFYEDEVLDSPDLKLPHPFIAKRRFALVPLNEIAATMVHPTSQKTIAQMLEECDDPLHATLFEKQI